MNTTTAAKIAQSDNEMQAKLDRISAASRKAYADKIAAETAARAARAARIAAMPASTCKCSTETRENSWSACGCDNTTTRWN